MDANEAEADVQLYKHSRDLIKDLDHELTTQLRKPDNRGGTKIRPWVRTREMMKSICSILDLFQELPQLLDPHLPKWIPYLAETYLKFLLRRGDRIKSSSNGSKWLVPLDYAICKILYTFCKVRGEKVIVRFLNVEAKYLELLLSALEDAEQQKQQQQQQQGQENPTTDETPISEQWSWEQRYIVLLWLSHLFLAPFDLSTISSVDFEDGVAPTIPNLKWPKNIPGITMRVVPIGIKYLATAGKERDAAKALLVRVAMRRDMQELGILESLVHWAMASLRPRKDATIGPPYYYLGILAFLAGVLRSSSETSDMDRYLVVLFQNTLAISAGENDLSKIIISLALARKMIIKVIRSIIVALLRQPQPDRTTVELTETAIGYLLDSLSDNDTPVRLAASKALSIITLKLDPDMASEVVEAVLESLNRNVLWNNMSNQPETKPVRDLSAVNSLEWHGLTLTLSHLLYRRSPPARQLSDIVHALLLGLSFEQRGLSGASIGANVRDAACFGIWALARRYSTAELLTVPTKSVFAAKSHPASSSILQVLGTELVMTASLDPEGNIRRGASAALQELIGRHPDTVEKGIGVVQVVDYHAVARRSRAIEEVATNASKLSKQYGEAIVDGILGWRGIGDMDVSSRRVAGASFGVLTAELSDLGSDEPFRRLETSMELVMDQINMLEKRQVEEKHGLLACLAGVLNRFPDLARQAKQKPSQPLLRKILTNVSSMLENCKSSLHRRPEIIAEAASRLVVASLPVVLVAVSGECSYQYLQKGEELLCSKRAAGYAKLVSALASASQTVPEVETLRLRLQDIVPDWLIRNEPEAIEPAAIAGLMLLVLCKTEERQKNLEEWAKIVGPRPGSRHNMAGYGYFHSLSMAQPLAQTVPQDSHYQNDVACAAFLERWGADTEIETRVAILQSLIRSRILKDKPSVFLDLLANGLNDYTTTARGDVGSQVRVQALKAIAILWQDISESDARGEKSWVEDSVQKLVHSTLRLAAEKLDRVRREAQAVVALIMKKEHTKSFATLTFSSKTYFTTLLNLVSVDCLNAHVSEVAKSDRTGWMAGLMAGFVTSADTGNDELVITSRAALTDFCQASPEKLQLVCTALFLNLKTRQGDDKVIVPTLEIIAFLFHVGLFQQSGGVNWRNLCLQTQVAGYKTGNVRKVAACVKVYGGIAAAGVEVKGVTDGNGDEDGPTTAAAAVEAGVKEARKRLGALMSHPWPRVRSAVVDELWGLTGIGEDEGESGSGSGRCLMGVDWAVANKGQIKTVLEELSLG